ncbi:hypothetical protein M0R45_016045 [Rubus argutus]|uniref:Endonuclease/exonuclease/phosphatase domain-containing protein n=1 Tax=Rubus argutus TaxID=59490 RepID=A0AAW1XSA6_RUBAR
MVEFVASFIYAANGDHDRRSLWSNLVSFSSQMNHLPWIVLGDFNIVLVPSGISGGDFRLIPAMDDFQNCMFASGLDDLRFSGNFFTWSNLQQDENCTCRKLERVLVNENWLHTFPNCFANFMGLWDL